MLSHTKNFKCVYDLAKPYRCDPGKSLLDYLDGRLALLRDEPGHPLREAVQLALLELLPFLKDGEHWHEELAIHVSELFWLAGPTKLGVHRAMRQLIHTCVGMDQQGNPCLAKGDITRYQVSWVPVAIDYIKDRQEAALPSFTEMVAKRVDWTRWCRVPQPDIFETNAAELRRLAHADLLNRENVCRLEDHGEGYVLGRYSLTIWCRPWLQAFVVHIHADTVEELAPYVPFLRELDMFPCQDRELLPDVPVYTDFWLSRPDR